jgi:adenylate cyclase
VSERTASLLPDCALLEAGALTLKGKSSRTNLFAVVGDERLARSNEFDELRALHGQLVEALKARSPATRRIVAAAKVRATDLMSGLREFYGRISRRAEHFRDESTAG